MIERPRKHQKKFGLLLLLLFLLSGCSTLGRDADSGLHTPSEEGLKVVTTFYPVQEFASQVVGENGSVQMLLAAGQDTHHFEPTPKDMAAIYDADLFVYASNHMEAWVPAVLAALEDSDVKILEAAETVPFYEGQEGQEGQEEEHGGHGHHHAVDPHVWLNPLYAEKMVSVIAGGAAELDPQHAESYRQNAERYQKKLQQLDQEYEVAFENAVYRTFVVQHAAFGYLARRYDLNEVSLSSLSSDQEVSPAKMAEIGEFVRENHIQAIYYQDSASAKTAQTLAEETGTELLMLHSLEGIPQKQQEAGADYLSVMRQNLEALKKTIH